MSERRAGVVLATMLALTFAAIAVKGVAALRSFDPRSRQLEERLLPEASINSGELQGAEAYAPLYGSAGAVADFAQTLLLAVVYLCLVSAFACLWVVSIHRRNMRCNPPRAPTLCAVCHQGVAFLS